MTSSAITTSWPNLAAMFFKQSAKLGDKPFLWRKTEGHYHSQSWNQIASRIKDLANGLIALGIEPGDRVVLLSENRPSWVVADLAIMAIGAITVPAYTTNTTDDHKHILNDSQAKGVIVSTPKLAANVMPAARTYPDCQFIMQFESDILKSEQGILSLSIDSAVDAGRKNPTDIEALAATWAADDTASIIYTSGTGGQPKGVMLSHKNLFHNCNGATDALLELGLDEEVFLSFLPLSHSYEHMAGHFFPMTIGAEIYYAVGIDTLAANMVEAKPTIMTAVPRLYETMYQRILSGVQKSGGFKEKLFMKTLELGAKKYADPQSLTITERLIDHIVDTLVRDKVRARFGGQLKALVSGGAPLHPDIGLFFTSLGLCILQGYGQTETAPLISVNRPSKPTMHTVGPPVINTEIKIAGDGEIMARGDLVMQGYWRNEAATKQVIQDGWVLTGDIGHLDDHGHLIITDRKKDIIVNSGGDNIAPGRIEGILSLTEAIAQVVVFGDKRPHLIALIVPDEAWLNTWKVKVGKNENLSTLSADKDLHSALAKIISDVNQGLSNIEKIRKFIIADEKFTIHNEQLTPTQKVRRHKVTDVYGERLNSLYR